MVIRISNRDARRLWLDAQGLAAAPTGAADMAALAQIVRGLGFVQLDTIRVVARAHDHILWSRNQNYREPMLNELMCGERAVFEHFTHDAAILPTEFYPHWRRQFDRMRRRIAASAWMGVLPPPREREKIRKRIETEGPLSTRAFEGKADRTRHAWARTPHKYALDYMWYAGVLGTAKRENFIKFYDLAERVIPAVHREPRRDVRTQIDWLCAGALDRLAFAREGEIQRFWDAADLSEVRAWATSNAKRLATVEVETADGGAFTALAPANIEARLALAHAPAGRMRILNPFDPAVRDRARLSRLFGFDYRIEIFTPAAKRQYGYYVYPLLEGDRFAGRIEVRAERKAGRLRVERLWPEAGVRFGGDRRKKLDAELARLARFVGAEEVVWAKHA